ncbi:hypothetical protein JR316_0002877 [Psilocybe cubensis]|uniref:Uncharacterized protein n=2 Tax=Psilocybe cubensis TaxID=181762 RepID=A0A8H7Y3H7_PSICU|nr:hypothetical protein JR316_0002877 [Psilocybe cubensis]KAH9483411.1 hypothetical protein JR316_0002877 [Psilocybe cubensis]
MPSKNHSSAPKFDGTAGSLPMFLDDIEQLATSCELTPKQTIDWTIRYAPGSDEHELWSGLDTSSGDDWIAFKRELLAQYPGSTGDRKYSVANLEMLTEKQAAGQITNSEQFGTYYRAFSKISRFLKSKNKLNDREISNLFMRGLDYAFRVQVRAQLRAENPKHHSDDPYTLNQICEAALFILSCNHDDTEIVAPALEASPSVKREHFDISSIAPALQQTSNFNMSALALELIKQMNLQHAPSNVYQNAQNQGYPTLQTQGAPTPRNNDCSFCSDPSHYQHSCAKAVEYIKKGLCVRNSENFLVLPDGTRVTPRTAPGRNIMERVDNWHKSKSANSPTVSSNMVSAGSEFKWEIPTTSAFAAAMDFAHNEVAPPTERVRATL